MNESTAMKKDWVNILFLTLTPILGIPVTVWYTWTHGFEWWMLALLVVSYLLVGFSICAGYHRFSAHRSYDCSPVIQFFYAFFGAMAAQNSILWWASSHRVHHQYVDKDWDPYNIKRGFWWAHIFWIFFKNPEAGNFENARDLQQNPIVRWQNRWHKHILILGGFGIPTLVGWYFGDPIAGLLWGGFLRIVVIHHTTFFVNSLAHYVGDAVYNAEVSARDNWAVALLTLGEGYHSFHHRFPADFRNGIKWYHWDPSKWWIGGLRAAGLASKLRETPPPLIEQARMEAAVKDLQKAIESTPAHLAEEIRRVLDRARGSVEQSFALWKEHLRERSRGASKSWKTMRRNSRRRLREARKDFQLAMRLLATASM